MHTTNPEIDSRLQKLDIYASYQKSKYLSVKHSSYFQVYEDLLSRFRNRKFTFVEVGVLNGGSLFMWRDYFGPEARIIGVELNPLAKRWESAGFEIHIGSQSNPQFWQDFFAKVGDVDVILDDGGHTNEQQIVTSHHCIPHIRDQGMLIIEDTHCSYLKKNFGNPSKYSFINYSKRIVDRINTRFPSLHVTDDAYSGTVYSVAAYESIVCFHIDREKSFVSSPTSNGGISSDAQDFRHAGTKAATLGDLRLRLARKFSYLKNFPLIRATHRWVFDSLLTLHSKFKSRRLKKYFD
jgi:hypothetical protein